MRRHLLPLGLAALWLSPFPVQAQPATSLTLTHALELAAARSPALSAAQHELAATDGALRQAAALRNPEFNATVEDTRRATRTTTATLDFPLEFGGKRAARVVAADRQKALAQAELRNTRAQLKAAVVQAFFGVLVAQEKLKLSTDAAALASRSAQATAQRVAAGKVSPVDATRAGVDQANAQLEAAEAQAELLMARQALAALWGDGEPQFAEVQGEVERLPAAVSMADITADMDASPSLVSSRMEVERRQALTDIERSRQYPDLTLSVGAKRDNDTGRTQAVVGISIPLPLFDRNQGALQEAARRADKAGDELLAARVRLLTELQRAAGQLAVARSAAQTLQATVLPAAQQAHDAAIKGYEAGKFGFLDVIDAQRALLQARTRHLHALSAAHQAATAIDRLLGR